MLTVLETGQHAPYVKEMLEFFGQGALDEPPESWDEPCPSFFEHPARLAYRDDVVAAMDHAAVDALIYPTWSYPPAHLERPREEYRGDNSQIVAPDTGLPAISVPMGYTYEGLPAGLQMLGRPYSEGLLFKLAYAYEQTTRHRRPPEAFPALP